MPEVSPARSVWESRPSPAAKESMCMHDGGGVGAAGRGCEVSGLGESQQYDDRRRKQRELKRQRHTETERERKSVRERELKECSNSQGSGAQSSGERKKEFLCAAGDRGPRRKGRGGRVKMGKEKWKKTMTKSST